MFLFRLVFPLFTAEALWTIVDHLPYWDTADQFHVTIFASEFEITPMCGIMGAKVPGPHICKVKHVTASSSVTINSLKEASNYFVFLIAC